jgi:hypothetical protein
MKKLFVIIAVLLLAGQAFGQTVRGVAGSVSNGQAITITGNGFGANGPAVGIFDNFENGTAGSKISLTSATIGQWSAIATDGTSSISYDNTQAVSGNLSCKVKPYNRGENGGCHLVYNLPTGSFDHFFATWWFLIPSGSVHPGNWKQLWVSDTRGETYGADICLAPHSTFSNFLVFGNNVHPHMSHSVNSSFEYPWSVGTWYRVSWWMKSTTKETSEVRVYMTDSSGTSLVKDARKFIALNANASGKRTGFSLSYQYNTRNSLLIFDDVYFAYGDYAQARVEICNSKSYKSCTKFAMCTTPLGAAGPAWTDTQIQCTVRQGNVMNGAAYLYVTNANGNTSSGYAVYISSDGTTR